MLSSLHKTARQKLVATARWRAYEWIFWVLAVAAMFIFPRHQLLLNEIAILGLFALSLDLLLGYAGIVSLGHAAYFGLGAYVAGLLAINGYAEPVTGLLVGGVVAAVFGFMTSFFVLRGTDLTRLMVTLGISMMIFEVANKFSGLTGGADGLQGIVMGPILGMFEFDMFGRAAYVYSLSVLFALLLIARRIVHSPFGLSVRSIKENPLRAASLGIPVNRRLVWIYTLGSAYAGIAGALLAQTTQFVSLDVLDFHRSADALLVLVLGGTGYLYGGMFGAAVFRIMQDVLSSWTPQYWQFWVGLVLVAVVVIGRDRFFQGAGRLVGQAFGRLRRRRTAEPALEPQAAGGDR